MHVFFEDRCKIVFNLISNMLSNTASNINPLDTSTICKHFVNGELYINGEITYWGIERHQILGGIYAN